MLKLIVTDKNGNLFNYQFNTSGEMVKFKNHHDSVNAWGDGYSFVIKDMSDDIAAEDARKAERVSRIDQLKAIDWVATDTVAELKAVVRLLTREVIKDDE